MGAAARPDPSAARGERVTPDLLRRLRHGRHLGVPAVVAAVLVATVAAGSVAGWAGSRAWAPAGVEAAAPGGGAPVPAPILTAGTLTGPNTTAGPHTAVPWQGPLTLTVSGGTLREVTV